MPTKAQLVREALETEIKKVSGIGHVSSQVKLWKDESNLPAAYVILDSDDSRFEPTESKTVDCRFRIATVLQSEKPQDVFDDLSQRSRIPLDCVDRLLLLVAAQHAGAKHPRVAEHGVERRP